MLEKLWIDPNRPLWLRNHIAAYNWGVDVHNWLIDGGKRCEAVPLGRFLIGYGSRIMIAEEHALLASTWHSLSRFSDQRHDSHD